MTQIWLAVDEDGEELLFSEKPVRSFHTDQVFWVPGSDWGKILPIPTGTIEKLIGRKLTWEDEAVIVEGERR